MAWKSDRWWLLLAAVLFATSARAQTGGDPGIEIPAGVDLTLPGDAPPAPSGNGGVDLTVPGGMDLDVIPAPVPAEGDPEALENPLDRDFETALAAYRERDYPVARERWAELSDAGHELSMHNLAVLLWRGQGGPQEPERALDLFRSAADSLVPQSLHALGVMHLHGLGVTKDQREAVRYFGAASAHDWAPSSYNLALAHFNGIGGANDPELGMALMRSAAERGLVRAQYDLAGLLYRGTYGPADPEGARLWFERAAEGGDPFAAYNLALMQFAGEGGLPAPEAGLANLTWAAAAGAVPAQLYLGHMLATGEGGQKRDLPAAYKWFAIAAGLGDTRAKENMKRLSAAMTETEIAEAKAAAAAYRPTPVVIENHAISAQNQQN